MDLSIVVPVYNEDECVRELHRRTVAALESTGLRFELIFVDDGSTDRTFAELEALHAADPRVRVVKLRRNFGQTQAMRAGIDHANGERIVTMDGDLQNEPADIPRLVARLDEGYELVTGWRRSRHDAWLSRKLPSRAANWAIARLTGVAVHDNGCSLKAYRAALIKRTPMYGEMHRFLPAMVAAGGGRIAEEVVRHHPRERGVSKYGLSRVGKVLLDMFTIKMLVTFSQRPLHWFALLSVPWIALSALFALYFVFVRARWGEWTPVFTSLAILCGFCVFHLLVAGLVGELIVRTGKPYGHRSANRAAAHG
ncbi:MAG: glycosyltransferase family 2 protein [Acidobacteria bacterium]|nr:glycosyltransferase family 2 protein [Acidobacteriota bacterium]